MPKEKRYFLSQDGSSHWYIIPLNKMQEWDEWVNIDEDDPEGWKVPDYAQVVGGSPCLVTFTDPRLRDK
jgi:hypothetical protein